MANPNPFNKTPKATPAPAAQAAYNPFAGSNEQEERLPLMSGGVLARAKVLGYRITPRTATSGTYVYVDLELLQVVEGEDMSHKPGRHVTHRLGGFESSGAAAAQRSLKELNLAIRPELKTQEGVDFDTLPFEMQESEEILGREIWIKTSDYVTKSIDPKTGKNRVIVKGEYQPVDAE